MNEEQLVRSAIASMLSYAQDNAQRARMRGMAPQVLDDYESHEYDCQRALEWFENLVKESK